VLDAGTSIRVTGTQEPALPKKEGRSRYLLRHFSILTPKALQWPNFGHNCFGHVVVIRRCDMIFWEFYGK
jgi:hypothetical protein